MNIAETPFVDTQAAFDRVLAQLHPMRLAWDRVHPTLTGHMVLARTFLNTVGYEWREQQAVNSRQEAGDSTTGCFLPTAYWRQRPILTLSSWVTFGWLHESRSRCWNSHSV
jgi:hypothetical protein